MNARALIFGLKGLEVSKEERDFFAQADPWGFILFARNVDTPDQVTKLCADLRACVGRKDAPIFVDQEGGRVQRFRPPHWTQYPAASVIGELYERNAEKGLHAAWLLSRLHAFDLLQMGVTANCLPVLDLPSPDGHGVIGDRAYGMTVEQVSALGQAACDGLLAGGVKPIIKHIPGHGRATADSHHDLPTVKTDRAALETSDFKPFVNLNKIDMAMTAHVVYSDIDTDAPATTSRIVMNEIIRGHMGYDGLVMCDDIMMGALSGDLTERTRAIFAAGCDTVLHCSGVMEEMKVVAQATPILEGNAARRATQALAGIGLVDASVEAECRAELESLINETLVASLSAAENDPTNYGKTP